MPYLGLCPGPRPRRPPSVPGPTQLPPQRAAPSAAQRPGPARQWHRGQESEDPLNVPRAPAHPQPWAEWRQYLPWTLLFLGGALSRGAGSGGRHGGSGPRCQGTGNAVSSARPQLVGLAASGRPQRAELRRGSKGSPSRLAPPPPRPRALGGRRLSRAPSREPRGAGVSAGTGVRGLELGIYSFVLPRFVRL